MTFFIFYLGGDQLKIMSLDAKDHSADGKVMSYGKLMSQASGNFKRADFEFDDLVCLPYSSGKKIARLCIWVLI